MFNPGSSFYMLNLLGAVPTAANAESIVECPKTYTLQLDYSSRACAAMQLSFHATVVLLRYSRCLGKRLVCYPPN